jgi:hypothetical protein
MDETSNLKSPRKRQELVDFPVMESLPAAESVPAPVTPPALHPVVDLEAWAARCDVPAIARRIAEELTLRGFTTSDAFRRKGANQALFAVVQTALGMEVNTLQSLVKREK